MLTRLRRRPSIETTPSVSRLLGCTLSSLLDPGVTTIHPSCPIRSDRQTTSLTGWMKMIFTRHSISRRLLYMYMYVLDVGGLGLIRLYQRVFIREWINHAGILPEKTFCSEAPPSNTCCPLPCHAQQTYNI